MLTPWAPSLAWQAEGQGGDLLLLGAAPALGSRFLLSPPGTSLLCRPWDQMLGGTSERAGLGDSVFVLASP